MASKALTIMKKARTTGERADKLCKERNFLTQFFKS